MPHDENFHGYITSATQKKQILEIGNINRVPPSVGIFDEPTRCYKINQEWAAVVMGMVHWLADVAAWPDAQDDSYFAIGEILKFMIGMECSEMVDCNDVVDCMELDPDYLALQSVIFSQSQANTQTHVQSLDDAYDGSPQSVGPNIPVAAPDATEQDALCYALQSYISLYAVTKSNIINQKNGLQILWNKLRTAQFAVFNAALDFTAPFYDFDLYACWATDAEALTALADDAALAAVACCLLDELNGVAISESNFNDAITACSMALTGTAGDVACVLFNDNNLDVYLMFLESYNIALQRQIDGDTLPVCPCDEPSEIEIGISSGCAGLEPIAGTIEHQGGNIWRLTSETTSPDERFTIRRKDGGEFEVTTASLVAGSASNFRALCTGSTVFLINGGAIPIGVPCETMVITRPKTGFMTYDLTINFL